MWVQGRDHDQLVMSVRVEGGVVGAGIKRGDELVLGWADCCVLVAPPDITGCSNLA